MKLPTISEAARQLGASPRRVFKILRQFDLLGPNDLARAIYIDRGYFVVETRDWRTPGGTVRHQYTITTVTPKGLALIQDILDLGQQAIPPVQGLRGSDADHRRAT